MKVSALKTEKRVELANWRGMGIQAFGANNDYPQRVAEIVASSVTGSACVNIYSKFISGRGFAQRDFYQSLVNEKETADDLLRKVSNDFAEFGGFALHVNYNAGYKIVSVHHIPFEWLRFEMADEDGKYNKIALHKDWGKRNTAVKPFRTKDIKWFDMYDSDPAEIREQVTKAGGWEHWDGQILYYSNKGNKCYSLPIFDSALTDMSTEEGLSNVTLRNARNNFLPAGMLIDHNNIANSEEQEEENRKELTEFQGDTNAGKLFYVNLQDGETEPEFKPFQANNTDKEFTNADTKIPQTIGRSFNQPPILRSEDVGSNFGADMMRNAYDFYNSVTETERMDIERVFAGVFSQFFVNINPEQDYRILPKTYRVNQTLAEKLGADTAKVVEIVTNTEISPEQKTAILSVVYGVDEEDIIELINGKKL